MKKLISAAKKFLWKPFGRQLVAIKPGLRVSDRFVSEMHKAAGKIRKKFPDFGVAGISIHRAEPDYLVLAIHSHHDIPRSDEEVEFLRQSILHHLSPGGLKGFEDARFDPYDLQSGGFTEELHKPKPEGAAEFQKQWENKAEKYDKYWYLVFDKRTKPPARWQ